ncbi:MAG TPA: hypothetical protein VMX58_10820 [Patescibacteria group bacterium]|nr:hypothetical protein [Patescibacteria group bacterium]
MNDTSTVEESRRACSSIPAGGAYANGIPRRTVRTGAFPDRAFDDGIQMVDAETRMTMGMIV